ncbi:MAG TPA: hypothetical protein VLJ17_14760 [Xanthobacteraceae bacterium]|nr:hypothetical protein [Xanthobacteraceae bacterium]
MRDLDAAAFYGLGERAAYLGERPVNIGYGVRLRLDSRGEIRVPF